MDQQQFLERTRDVAHMANSGNVWFRNEIPLKEFHDKVLSRVKTKFPIVFAITPD